MFSVLGKTWLTWNGKRVRLESVKHCKRRKSSESGMNDKSGSDSTQSSSKAQSGKSSLSIPTASVCHRPGRDHEEEQQSKSHQSMNRASVNDRVFRWMPLRGSCAASPGAWSSERFGRCPSLVSKSLGNLFAESCRDGFEDVPGNLGKSTPWNSEMVPKLTTELTMPAQGPQNASNIGVTDLAGTRAPRSPRFLFCFLFS